MKSLGPVYVVIAVVIAMMAAGAAFVLFYNGSYDADASRNGDTVEYSVRSAGSNTYTAVALSTEILDSVVIYRDGGYRECIEMGPIPVGAPALTTGRFADELTILLKQRGFGNVSVADAQGLAEVCSDIGSAHGKAIVCVSGALPDTVYDGTSSSSVLSWIEAGGMLYWAGNVIGLYSASAEGISEHVNGPSLFIGASSWCSEKGAFCTGYDGELTGILGLHGSAIRFAPAHNAGTYTTGFTDGEYSTVTYLQHGLGQICILAGELYYDHYYNMAQLIGSGTAYGAEILGRASGTVTRTTVTGSFRLSDPSAGATVFVFIGKGTDSTLYGRSFWTDAP